MDDRYYPELPEGAAPALNTIRLQAQEDPGYLEAPDCPYTPEDREILLRIFGNASPEAGLSSGEEDESSSDISAGQLEDRIKSLFLEMKAFGDTLDEATPQEKAAYFRVSVSLLDKIASLMERATKVREFKDLMNALLSFMEEQMDADQRTQFMDYIKEFV